MPKLKAILLVFIISIISASNSLGQCAMCRATLETNVSNGSQEHLASTLNFGILYLFVTPYLLIAIVGYIWYKQSRSSSQSKK